MTGKMERVIKLAGEIKELGTLLTTKEEELKRLINDGNNPPVAKVKNKRGKWNGWAKRRLSKRMKAKWAALPPDKRAEWIRNIKKNVHKDKKQGPVENNTA